MRPDSTRGELVCPECLLVVSKTGVPLDYDMRTPYRKVRSNPGPNTQFLYGELNSKNPKKNGSNQLILTCPHAQCEIPKKDYDKHLCDWIAEDSLMAILKHLGDEPNTKFFIGKDVRMIWDLNRKRSRVRPFRKAVAEVIKPNDLHIDVHSYPNSDLTDNWHKYDFVLFKHGNIDLINSITHAVKEAGFTIMLLPADRINDMANHGTELGAHSCLLEFNSELKDSNRLDAAGKAVAKGILEYRRKIH